MRRILLALLLLAAPAEAHMMVGRRPFDALIAKAGMAAFVSVEQSTRETPTAGGSLAVTSFRVISCVKGACPRGRFRAGALDDHGAHYPAAGRTIFVAFAEAPIRVADGSLIAWRTLPSEWEARTLAEADPADLRRFSRVYAALLTSKAARREGAYVSALLDQLAAAPRWLQEDALQSLLRLPAVHPTPQETDRLLRAAAATQFENVRVGVFLVAESWDGAALRRYLAKAPLDSWGPAARARAQRFFSRGTPDERAFPCRYLGSSDAAVRAAAVAACMPLRGTWSAPVITALDDSDADVREAARQRLRAHPDSRAAVLAWALAKLPWWRQAGYRMTGSVPPVVSEIFTDVGAARP